MSKILTILPTLNEEKNIKILFNRINKTKINTDIIYIDDNSKDRTIKVIKFLIFKNKKKKIFLISNKKRLGIGRAHKDALLFAYRNKYRYVFTLDSDLAHNPKYFFKLLSLIKVNDLVIGSRFIEKNLTMELSIIRNFLSQSAHFMTKFLFKHSYDATNSFRCYDLKKIDKKFIYFCKSDHYDFFFSSLAYLNSKNYKIAEFPMVINKRNFGNSKMNLFHIFNSLVMIFVIFFKIKFSGKIFFK